MEEERSPELLAAQRDAAREYRRVHRKRTKPVVAKDPSDSRRYYLRQSDAAFIASQTGTELKEGARDVYLYDYREVNRKPEIGGAYGNIPLNVEKHPDGGYVNTYR